jgi:hypothetical protein
MLPADVVTRLEHAGATLLALPSHGTRPAGLRSAMPDIVREFAQSYGWDPPPMRPAVPSAADIDAMDQAFGWLSLIPRDRYVLRRIVAARCLIAPLTGRHLYSWRRIARTIGCDHRAVQRWHAQGIETIVQCL